MGSSATADVLRRQGDRHLLGSDRRAWVRAAVSYTLIGLALGTIAGWRRLPLVEGWGLLPSLQAGSQMWWVAPDGPLGAHAARPLQMWTIQLGYIIDTTSFFGVNLLAFLAFVAKGLAARALLRQLVTSNEVAAFAGGLAFALSPAADGALIDRAVHIHVSTAFVFTGFALMARAHRSQRPALAVAAMVPTAIGLLMYEAGYVLAAAFPFFVLLLRPVGLWRWVRTWIPYGVTVLACGGFSLWASRQGGSYQGLIAATRRSLLAPDGQQAVRRALTWEGGGYFLGTVRDSLAMARPSLTILAWLLVLVPTAAIIVVALRRRSTSGSAEPARERFWLARVAVVGLSWVAVALAMYLPFAVFWYEILRVHSLAQFGPVLVATAVAGALLNGRTWKPVLGAALAGGLAFTSGYTSSATALMWNQWSAFQSTVLSAVLGAARTAPGRTIVIYDESDRLHRYYAFGPFNGAHLPLAYRVVSGDATATMVVCTTAGLGVIGPPDHPEAWNADKVCRRDATGLVLSDTKGGGSIRFADADTLNLVLRAGPQPQVTWLSASQPPLVAARSPFLPCVMGDPCSDDVARMGVHKAPFTAKVMTRPTNDDVPDRSFASNGFSSAIDTPQGLLRWTVADKASIFADLGPGKYLVRLTVAAQTSPGTAERTGIRVNGTPWSAKVVPGPDGTLVIESRGEVVADSPAIDEITLECPLAASPRYPIPIGLGVSQVSVEVAP